MEFRRTMVDDESLSRYEQLFVACFPRANHLRAPYLRWLYKLNPAGEVVGFDAFEGDELAAHYVCIPADISVGGQEVTALLSLNTATHPKFQGKGLFTKLASLTYELGRREGHAAVFGVANANSTPGFTRKLGFQLVCPLEARIGVGSLGVQWDACEASGGFRRLWTGESIRWRMQNPVNPVRAAACGDGALMCWARTGYPLLDAYCEVKAQESEHVQPATGPLTGRLFLGLYPRQACSYATFVPIPSRFRPSPLNLIWLDLAGGREKIDGEAAQFSFIDFDAY